MRFNLNLIIIVLDMKFPTKLLLYDSAYVLDGGTTRLFFTDEQNKEHILVLRQHAYISDRKYLLESLPGRLYFNESLIEIRSPEEKTLLSLLKTSELRNLSNKRIELPSNVHVFGNDLKETFSQSPQENLRSMLRNVIAFVESDEYISFAEKVNDKINSHTKLPK